MNLGVDRELLSLVLAPIFESGDHFSGRNRWKDYNYICGWLVVLGCGIVI